MAGQVAVQNGPGNVTVTTGGDDTLTFFLWKQLLDAGVYVNAVISPATPKGRQLLRTSVMATHTTAQLDRVLETFATVGKQVGLI